MMRGLDFLFGHAQGYGERRIGTDVYGTPIYANKRTATESVAVQVEQPPVQRLEYHQPSMHPDGLDSVSFYIFICRKASNPQFCTISQLFLSSCEFELVIKLFEVGILMFLLELAKELIWCLLAITLYLPYQLFLAVDVGFGCTISWFIENYFWLWM
jgi:hypothetical protein